MTYNRLYEITETSQRRMGKYFRHESDYFEGETVYFDVWN